MSEDIVMRLLRQVKSGEVSLEDARFALEDVNLTEEEYITAVDHGVFNMPEASAWPSLAKWTKWISPSYSLPFTRCSAGK